MAKPIRRLVKARKELNVLISMVENNAPSLELVRQSRRIQSELTSFNREILLYHFFVCIKKQIRSKTLRVETENIAKVFGINNVYE